MLFSAIAVSHGIGIHQKILMAINPELIVQSLLYTWIASNTAVITVCLGKNSIIAFILELQGNAVQPRQKWFLGSLAVCNFILSLASLPVIWTQCFPVNKLWDNNINGYCRARPNLIYSYCEGSKNFHRLACIGYWRAVAFGALLDFILALYPVTIFWKLQLPLHRKFGLSMLFGVGIL